MVIKSKSGVNFFDSGLTMTDLKKSCSTSITESSIARFKNSDKTRVFPLLVDLFNLHLDDYASDDRNRIPLKMPILLGGQISSNQTGYGWEYYGEELTYQGTAYGETTKFLIIGIALED